MGKNQQHKAMQAARHSASSAGADEQGTMQSGDGMVDASFHTPEWHAARIAQLTTERMTWEEWKIKKKEDDKRRAAEEDAEENLMREYRKQLDADREAKLARGWNHKELRDKIKSSKKRKHKDKDKKDKKDKKRKKDSKDKKDKKSKKSSKKRRKESSRRDESDSSDSDGSSGSSDFDPEADPDADKHRLSNFFEAE